MKNSGNIAQQTLTVPGSSFVQSYTYDSLYRLTEAVEKTGTTTNWSQQFGYDRYGNRTSFSQDIGGITKNTTPAVDANTNRFTSTDFVYDANGNIVEDIDEMTSLPREFIFNGDNKQTEVKRDGVTIGRYYYDGDGKRVKKVVPATGETTIFVYDAAAKLVAEYSTIVAPTQDAKVAHLTNDHLGSPRINTDANGAVIARHDYHPFGEETYTSQRTAALGSQPDDVRQKFTGYERDNEINLDFAQARYYGYSHGRFTSPDPLYIEFRRLPFPQAWNLYVYTRNNPLTFVDPDGLEVAVNCKTTKEQTKACQEQVTTDLNNRKDAQFKVEIKNGKLSIVGKVDASKLSKSERKLYGAITDSFGKATLNVEMSSDKITFGRFDGAGQNSIDLADLSKLNGADKTLAGEVIAHEAIEGFESSLGLEDPDNPGALFSESHATANQFFGATSITVPDASALAGARVSSRDVIYNFGRLGTSVTVTKKFKTPVPIASITSANFPNLVGDIDNVAPKPPTQAPTKPREKP